MSLLAYKYVVISLMMSEVNYCATQLHLNLSVPIQNQDTIAQRAHEPASTGFIGGIDTLVYHFGFADSGKSRVITKLEDSRFGSMGLYRGKLSMNDYMEQLSKVHSVIDTNDAYQIASNCLTSIGMDVGKLQEKESLVVLQDYSKAANGSRLPVPLFHVTWGDRGADELGHHIGPVVSIMISGINRELLSLLIKANPYSKRSYTLVKDMDKLLAIPDNEFLKYSDLERSNLVVRFSAVAYPGPTNALLHAVEANNVITTNPTFPIIKNFAPTAVPPP